MQRCEKCNHDATLIAIASESAYVDYYRCPVCGAVWTAPEDGDESDPTEPASTESNTAAD